ncbi:hypothetical protein LL912_12460 [Niabella sp. CC-SYL272]|uniref:hypothetical protein n=1 Tax=Niabella agricola TaxID=2891571 RepID=UPI001F26BD0C|nr:hypothetical protein [Niabella agricola]MCF3109585.1 hypothetical protein [Niabella agricola]
MESLQFQVHSLLKYEDECVTGPMAPMLFASETMDQLGLSYNRLARIWFEDENIFQKYEGESLTSHDILVIGKQFRSGLWISLWIDEGVQGIPVATAFKGEAVAVSDRYLEMDYARTLTVTEIETIFAHIFENTDELDISR